MLFLSFLSFFFETLIYIILANITLLKLSVFFCLAKVTFEYSGGKFNFPLPNILFKYGKTYLSVVNAYFPISIPTFSLIHPIPYTLKIYHIISIPILKFFKEILLLFKKLFINIL